MTVPTVRWIDQIGGTEDDLTKGITLSSTQGRLFATGDTLGTLGLNSNSPGSGMDIWVGVYGLGGNLQDIVQFNSEAENAVSDDFANAIAVNPSRGNQGTLYVVGETLGDVTKNPDRAINRGGTDGFVLIYTPTDEQTLNRNPTAAFQFDVGNDGGRDFAYDVALDNNGNVYVVGKSQQGETGFDAYVAKFTPDTLENFDPDQTNQAEWIETFSTPASEEARGVVIKDSELFVTGFTTGDIDDDGEGGDGDSNIWLAKITGLNDDEREVTINELESSGEDRAYDLVISGKDIYLTGDTQVDSRDDTDNDLSSNLGRQDVWVAKFDGETFTTNATPNWIEQFGSGSDDFARGITAFSTLNEDGELIETTISVTGYSDGAFNGQQNAGSFDAWVTQLIDDRAEDAISEANQSPAFTESPIFGETSLTFNVNSDSNPPQVTGLTATDQLGKVVIYEIINGDWSARDNAGNLTILNNGEVLGTIKATDQQGDKITYSITSVTPEAVSEALELNATTGELTLVNKTALTESAIFTIEARDNDPNQNTNTVELIIPVDQNNDLPILSNSTFDVDSFAADTTVGILNFENPDPDGNDTLTFSINNGDDNEIFSIADDTGQLTVNSADVTPGDSFPLEITINDGTETDNATVTVNFTNESPVFTQDQGYDFALDPANAGAFQATVTANDPEGQAVSYSITGGDPNNAFTIDSTLGEITVADETQLTGNFELIVQADDNTSPVSTTQVAIALSNQEIPVLSDSTFEVNQFAGGTTVGTLNFENPDPDGNDTLDFIINSGDDNGLFTINDGTGELSVNSADVTPGDSFPLEITINDGTETDTATVTVNFTNESPVFTQEQGYDFAQRDRATSNNGDVVGTVTATDPEAQAGTTVTYSIVSGNDPDGDGVDAFNLDENTGQLTINNVNELTTNFDLTVQADDSTSPPSSTQVIVPVVSKNDPPVISASELVTENVHPGGEVGLVKIVDPDLADASNLTLELDDPQFEIDENGIITLTDQENLSLGDTVDIEVTATDLVGVSTLETITVSFLDLVELDPETGTELLGTDQTDFSQDITTDRGGNLYLGGETVDVIAPTAPPVIVDSYIVGKTVTVRYNQPLDSVFIPSRANFQASITPALNGETFDEKLVPVTQVEIEEQSVILTLAEPATVEDTVNVIYLQPSTTFNDVNAIQSVLGNDANNFAENPINLTGQGITLPELTPQLEEEVSAGGSDIWLSRFGNSDSSPATETTESPELRQPTQSVLTNIDEIITEDTPLFQSGSFTLDVNYTATDANGNLASELSGLGLRMHYDSDRMTPTSITLEDDEIASSVSESLTSPSNLEDLIQPDTSDFDGDGSTDRYILLSWIDQVGPGEDPAWPGNLTETDPATQLFDITFTTANDFAGDQTSTINFTASNTANGYSFSSSDPIIAPKKYTYDVDDNGRLDPLTDGLQILSHLIGGADADTVIESAIAANANRNATEIKEYLNLGEQASNPFDVDGNGTSNAFTDGIIIARYMFGFRGNALVDADVLGNGATRTTGELIESFIQDFLPV